MARHAIVIGASMAGLCAARVLSRSFERVTVLDRDELPDDPELRAGVPQGRHVHALIARGARELERLFPGFLDEYRGLGAHELDVPRDGAVLRACGWQRPMASGHTVFFATRGLTESIVRRRVRALPGVELLARHDVAGLVTGGEPSRVRGVQIQRRGEGGESSELAADLVVDASGRTSRLPAWLAELGRPAPQEVVVNAFCGYSSRWYEGPDPARVPADHWWKMIWIDPAPPEVLQAGVLFPVEGGRFIVTLIGYSKQYPPSDEEGFEQALHALRSPVLARTVALSRPISPVYSNRALVNRLRRFDRLSDPLPGVLALGDSVCTFNPMYGQGMSAATLSALALEETLARTPPDAPALAREFFAAQAAKLRDPWSLATGADMLFPATQSESPPPSRLMRSFATAIQLAMSTDQRVLRAVTPSYYLLRPNRELLTKKLAAQVLLAAGKELLRRRLSPRPRSPMPPPRV